MMDLAMALRSDSEKVRDPRAGWLVAAVMFLADVVPPPLLRLVAWGWPGRDQPGAAGSGGIKQVAGMPLDPIDLPANQQTQVELTSVPLASDVFMDKKIEGLRPAPKLTDAAH